MPSNSIDGTEMHSELRRAQERIKALEQEHQEYEWMLTVLRTSTVEDVRKLVDAARLTVLHFKRSQASGNFQGDDEHEAWTALAEALKPFPPEHLKLAEEPAPMYGLADEQAGKEERTP